MRSTRALGLVAIAAAAVVARRYRIFPVRVAGASMEPSLSAGDLLAVSPRILPRVGDIVIVDASGMQMIKRVTSMHGDSATLEGDNREASAKLVESIDHISGVALFRYWPAWRRLKRSGLSGFFD